MPIPRFSWRALTLAVFAIFGTATVAQPPPPPVPAGGAPDGALEMTRGPLHEAFGQPTTFNPEPGPIAPKAPPEAVEELPPEQKPEGDNVAWIPGYWHWDDEEKNYLWVSGFWRAIPAGRSWVPGYWSQVDTGHQWVSGFWASAETEEIEYLPPPPESLEAGPPTEAVEGQIWIPGCWIWRERYVWRPGFWTAGNPDWLWVPAHYTWSPSGYVFIDGYWDYPMTRRGLLFAPVSFVDVRPGFVYRPTVVIDIRILVINLFCRPHYHHYYFGDYYAQTYARSGIYPWFAFHNSRYGYDPLFAHTRFVYGSRDADWSNRIRESYIYRRETEAARPPRTFRAYTEWSRRRQADDPRVPALAQPITAVARDRDFPVQLQQVSERQATVIKNQVTQINKFRDQRVQIEQKAAQDLPAAKGDPKGAVRPGRKSPARLKLPDVPKLGAAVGSKTGGTAAPAPPTTAPKAPAIDKDPPTPKGGKVRPLPDPEDNLRKDPGTTRPRTKGKDSDLTDPLPKKDRPKFDPDPLPKKDRPKLDPDPLPKKDRPKFDPPDRPLPKKDRPKLDPDPLPKKDRPKLDPPDRPLPPKKNPPATNPPKDPPDLPKLPPKKGPPSKKDKDKDG